MVYDIAAERRSLRVIGHVDDVNAVCFADESSTNVLVSGSDDGFVKVWDRRSLASSTPAGVLPGATEGITYTAPKGDGRYIVVNSKDQAARLYDLRKMRSWSEFETEREQNPAYRYGHERWDCKLVLLAFADCRPSIKVSRAKAARAPPRLLGDDVSRTLRTAYSDPVPFQPCRVDWPELHIQRERGRSDPHLESGWAGGTCSQSRRLDTTKTSGGVYRSLGD